MSRYAEKQNDSDEIESDEEKLDSEDLFIIPKKKPYFNILYSRPVTNVPIQSSRSKGYKKREEISHLVKSIDTVFYSKKVKQIKMLNISVYFLHKKF